MRAHGAISDNMSKRLELLQEMLKIDTSNCGETVLAVERYFVVHAPSEALSRAEWTLQETQVMADHRWWSAEALRATSDTVWPQALPQPDSWRPGATCATIFFRHRTAAVWDARST